MLSMPTTRSFTTIGTASQARMGFVAMNASPPFACR
jgi:hypothetical protein